MKTAILSALAIAMLPVLSFAGDADTGLPKVKVSWKPSFAQEKVILSVTNTGETSIKFSPVLEVMLDLKDVRSAHFEPMDEAPNVIYPMLKFNPTPGDRGGEDFSTENFIPPPTEIKPGETKSFTLFVPESAMRYTNLSAEANFLLRFNGKELDKVVMKKKDSVWKEE